VNAGFDPTTPNMARVYDYWLGGKDNYPADRAEAERLLGIYPPVRDLVRENRAFVAQAVDVPDRLRSHRLAHVRLASSALAVVVAVARSSARSPVRHGFTGYDRSPALSDDDQLLVGEDRQGVLECRHRNILQGTHLTDRRQRVACREHPGTDRAPDRICHLLPGRSAAGGVDGEDRHVPVLGERLPRAPNIAATP
jgi:hypothetical protein